MTSFHPDRQIINSRNHPQIKRLRRLHDRAERDRTGLYYVEGMRFVARAIQHQVPIEALISCPPLLTHPFARHLVGSQRQGGTPILEVTPEVLSSVSLVDDPQGIGAVVRQCWTPLDTLDPIEASCWIVLDTLQSPGNLGTILRTSEAVGASGLVVLGDAVDPYAPAVVRATMGSLFSQRFVRTTAAELQRWEARRAWTLVGTTPAAVMDYQALDYRGPTLLMLGGERKGLPADLLALCDVRVRIPMVGRTDSLNLSVAASLLLYEVFNQRRRQVASGVSA